MTLKSTAQELFALDKASPGSQLPAADMHMLEVFSPPFEGAEKASAFDTGFADSDALEVSEPVDVDLFVDDVQLSDIPGAPPGTRDPEPVLQVSDPEVSVQDAPAAADANEAKKDKKNEKWDWESKGPHGFVQWIKERFDSVPRHSGYDTAGLERAMAYLEKLDSEISKAMRMDLDEELDANKVEEVRAKIDDGISRLQSRLDKVKKVKKDSRRSKKSDMEEFGLVKEAQKIMGVQGVYITVPLLISRIARVCVNGTISAGHDIEDLYERQVKRWKLSDREQAELQQLLFDMGFPVRQDRGFMPDETIEVSDSNNMDWAANYKG